MSSSKLVSGWTRIILEDYVEIAARIGWRGLKRSEYTNEGPAFLAVKDINEDGTINFGEVTVHLSEFRYQESPEIQLKEDDILVTKDGTIGKIGFVEGLPAKATVNSSILVVRPCSAIIPKFLFYYLKGPQFQEIVREKITGSAVPHLFQHDIKRFQLDIPPLAEQRRIVSKIDELLVQMGHVKRALIRPPALLRRFTQSVLARAFRGELTESDPNDQSASELLVALGQQRRNKWEEELRAKDKDPQKYRYKEPKAGSFDGRQSLPEGWAWATLEQVAFVERGKFAHRPRNEPKFYGGKYPFIQTGDVSNAGGRIRTFKQTLNEKGFAISKLFRRGTIMVAIAANIGDSAVLEFDSCATDSVVGVTCIEPMNPNFVEFFLRTQKADLQSFAPATAQKNINLRILDRLPIPVAPVPEQRRIVSKVEELFAKVDAIQNAVTNATDNVRVIESSVLNRAFSGHLVPQNPNDEPASTLLVGMKAKPNAKVKKGKTQTMLNDVEPSRIAPKAQPES